MGHLIQVPSIAASRSILKRSDTVEKEQILSPGERLSWDLSPCNYKRKTYLL